MNEKVENPIFNLQLTNREVVNRIIENMLKTRTKKDVYYCEYTHHKGIGYDKILENIVVDLYSFFPKAKKGDRVDVDFYLYCETTYDIFLNFDGNVKVYYNDKEVLKLVNNIATPKYTQMAYPANVPVTAENGYNKVVVKCVCDGSRFGFSFNASVRRYPKMWANDYLFFIRNCCIDNIYKEGMNISGLISTGMDITDALDTPIANKDYIFPKRPWALNEISFNDLYDDGEFLVAYTEVKIPHRLSITGRFDKLYVNHQFAENNCQVNKGDKIMIKVNKGEKAEINSIENFELSFVKTRGQSVLICGPFFDNEAIEQFTDFDTVYTNAKNQKIYWRFLSDNTYLRIYLDSIFFGQWFYALMLGVYGIFKVGTTFNNQDYINYFNENMEFIAKYHPYIRYDADKFICPSFMPRSVRLDDLDSIGTMGANFLDSYFYTKNPDLESIIHLLIQSLESNIPTNPDGTFRRSENMWADDVYMSCPFLVRIFKYTKDQKWVAMIEQQLDGYEKRLFMENEKLFSHIYFLDTNDNNNIPWGRANGWIMLALSEILLHLDEDSSLKQKALNLFRKLAVGIQNHQNEIGMWHEVLNIKSSYFETSCTAMFVIAFARGVNNGWCDESYKKTVIKGWEALKKYSINETGDIYGVCMGSGCCRDPEYYCQIPTTINDDHGTAIVMLAGIEVEHMGIPQYTS